MLTLAHVATSMPGVLLTILQFLVVLTIVVVTGFSPNR